MKHNEDAYLMMPVELEQVRLNFSFTQNSVSKLEIIHFLWENVRAIS